MCDVKWDEGLAYCRFLFNEMKQNDMNELSLKLTAGPRASCR